MYESYSNLANAIASKKYDGQMADIRRLFRLLEWPCYEDLGDGAGAIAIMVSGAVFFVLGVFGGWIIWG